MDFGTSNSYLVKFASIPKELTAHQYPVFTLRPGVKEKLRQLELKLEKLRQAGRLAKDRLVDHAADQMLEVIFHSNKIEGNVLTKGETQNLLAETHKRALTETEREAKNLEAAYKWMLENAGSCSEAPESFIRHMNNMILDGVKSQRGEYRSGPITVSGMDFEAPAAASVPAFMRELSEEMRNDVRGRSLLECAAAFHTKLVCIHPFEDGNGRTARLLLNAFLFSNGLPVIVIDYADRERYLDCLKDSNKGDLSALVEFIIECFEQQLAEFELTAEISTEDLTTKPSVPVEAVDETDNPIAAALEAAGVKDVDDPLTAVLRSKVQERRKAIEAEYEAWKQSMLVIPAELSTIVGEVNASDLGQQVGYRMRLQSYDVLTFDRYADIAGGKRVTRTWFVSVDINWPGGAREADVVFQWGKLESAKNRHGQQCVAGYQSL